MSQTIGRDVKLKDGVFEGPVRAPVNPSSRAEGSIHNDAVATKLGFRGGTIAGSLHMDQFPPVLLEAFGDRWLETGSLSLYFVNATLGGEAVRVFAKQPDDKPDEQIEVWMDRDSEGTRVAEGTASVGTPSGPSELQKRDLRLTAPEELRMFREVSPGDPLEESEETLSSADQRARIEAGRLTEPIEWYTGESPWGGPVACPSAVVQLLWRKPSRSFGKYSGGAVGLFGAIETRFVNGPVLMDKAYRLGGNVVGVGQSPKTEYVWFDTHADDSEGKRVAEMRMLLRWMKASSPLYKEEKS